MALITICSFAFAQRNQGEHQPLPASALATLALMGVLDALALGVVLAAGIFERPEFASAGSSIFGLVTVVLAWLFVSENVSRVQWAGILMVFAAISYLSTV